MPRRGTKWATAHGDAARTRRAAADAKHWQTRMRREMNVSPLSPVQREALVEAFHREVCQAAIKAILRAELAARSGKHCSA